MTAIATLVYLVMGVTLIGNLIYLQKWRAPAIVNDEGPSVEILIPARNEEINIGRLLESLARQSYRRFSVIVYDDASADATAEVVRTFSGEANVRLQQGAGPPPGWTGKVHALYEATRTASADIYLFLDADVELQSNHSLARIVAIFQSLPPDSVLTGLLRMRGGGLLLVSLITNIILTMLPWFLLRRVPVSSLGAVAGGCWMISGRVYDETEPHLQVKDEILEDVRIGQYLRAIGIVPVLAPLSHDVSVFMYSSLGDAWRGLAKNSFLVGGGRIVPWSVVMAGFVFTFIVAPIVQPALFLAMYVLKLVTDRVGGIPLRTTLLAPVSYILAAGVQITSAALHLSGRVTWKGRRVGIRSSTTDS